MRETTVFNVGPDPANVIDSFDIQSGSSVVLGEADFANASWGDIYNLAEHPEAQPKYFYVRQAPDYGAYSVVQGSGVASEFAGTSEKYQAYEAHGVYFIAGLCVAMLIVKVLR